MDGIQNTGQAIGFLVFLILMVVVVVAVVLHQSAVAITALTATAGIIAIFVIGRLVSGKDTGAGDAIPPSVPGPDG